MNGRYQTILEKALDAIDICECFVETTEAYSEEGPAAPYSNRELELARRLIRERREDPRLPLWLRQLTSLLRGYSSVMRDAEHYFSATQVEEITQEIEDVLSIKTVSNAEAV